MKRFVVVGSMICVVLCWTTYATTLSAQAPDPGGGGGGGGGGAALTVSVAASPSPVLIGKTVTWTGVANGGTPEYSYSWHQMCQNQYQPGQNLTLAAGQSVLQTCMGKGGSILELCNAKDSSTPQLSGLGFALVNVLMPDGLVIPAGGGVFTVDGTGIFACDFILTLRRGNEDVGGCIVACAWEKDWEPGQQEPANWGRQGCLPTQSPEFYFASPNVWVHKSYSCPANWNEIGNGQLVLERRLRYKVDVPHCDGSQAIQSAVITLRITKVDADTVEFSFTSQ